MRFSPIGNKSLLPRRAFCIMLLMLPLAIGIAGCGGGSGNDGTISINPFVTINPISATLAPGATQTFRAGAVEGGVDHFTWKVREGDAGGTVTTVDEEDSAGGVVNYTAPQATGTYHLECTGYYNPSGTKTATVTVKVEQPQ